MRESSRMRRLALTALLALGAASALTWPAVAESAVAPSATSESDPQVETDQTGIATSQREQVLGQAWEELDDEVHVAIGDADGIEILTAKSSDGYAWSTTAALPAPWADTDLWLSNSCVTSSGDYMAVVYAPRDVTNEEASFGAGARAAVVDLRSGAVSDLGSGYTISYFNPGCGAADTFTITRFENEYATTRVAVIDAATAEIVRTTDIEGVATSAVSKADGTVLAVEGKDIVSIDATQQETVVATTSGVAYDLTLDESDRLAYVALDEGSQTATAYVTTPGVPATPEAIGAGAVTALGVEAAQAGGFYLVGANTQDQRTDVPGIEQVPQAGADSVISSTGALIIDDVTPAGITEVASAGDPQDSAIVDTPEASIAATVVRTGETVEFTLEDVALAGESGEAAATSGLQAGAATENHDASSASARAAGDAHDPIEDERYCSIPRNDPNNQVYQPKPRQVEWAVDRAVKGELTQVRPANWRNLGMPSYSPQGLFPKRTLTGGGTIPPQVVLGVLAQESNLWQASRFTAPGNTGNPLIGDFYGTHDASSIWQIDYEDADCGYGVGQITDGMRLAGHERTDDAGNKIETALPVDQQRAIALDYTANIAKVVQMLGDKWNQLAAAGMLVNDGDPKFVENWFLTTWAYNSGFYPYQDAATPWGVGWFNNPISTVYSPTRYPFLQVQSDAAHPQDWPYPEKVTGWAAYGTSLVETQYADPATRTYTSQYVSSFRTAWWNSDADRISAKPPVATFCDLDVNDCDPNDSEPCQLSDYRCWWHEPVAWKSAEDCTQECGQGFERFPSSYSTEASSMAASLPTLTLQSSYLPDCQSPPPGTVVVDDTTHLDARNPGECAHKNTTGSFNFTFEAANSGGNYPAKVDLHQQGGGFNGHFSFAHMQSKADTRTHITGTWNRGVDMNGTWTRVWVHLPEYAAWTQQAGYTIDLGDGTTQTRYLPQRRYANEWVSLGVFQMKGSPSVSLSNVLVDENTTLRYGTDISGLDDIAWDAVGFQGLPEKPDDFVVALGDSYGSGEGAGDYAPWSDSNGTSIVSVNSCHQSTNAWIRKTTLPGDATTIGYRADGADPGMDFHFLACSGAQTENLLPYYSVGAAKPSNAENQTGAYGQSGMVSQLDAGYLDENTTLVTMSIGGNDMRFSDVIATCVKAFYVGTPQDPLSADCSKAVLGGDTASVIPSSQARLADELPDSLITVIELIRQRAPNARIAVSGYPKLFESGTTCVSIADVNQDWLNEFADSMNTAIRETVESANEPGAPDIFYVDTQAEFTGHNLCTGDGVSGINGLQFTVTPGESPLIPGLGFIANRSYASRTSVHPNSLGTGLYSEALEDALALHS